MEEGKYVAVYLHFLIESGSLLVYILLYVYVISCVCTSINDVHSPSVTSLEDAQGVGVGVFAAVDVEEVTAASVRSRVEFNTIK